MNTNTLLFEEIQVTGVSNGENVAWWRGRHKNASGWERNYTFSKGRYGQEENDPRGDSIDQLPICPYHMPKNPNRFDEPSLFIAKKKVGDIIKARDFNELINRVRLLMYIWNAEIKDIYNYGGYDKTISPRYELLDTLEYIAAENSSELTDHTHDSRTMGARNNLKYLKRYYFMAESSSLENLKTILDSQKANPTNFDITDNNPCTFMLPHLLDTDSDLTNTINTGLHEMYSGKFVQEYGSFGLPHPEYYHIWFPKENRYLKNPDGNIKFFTIGENYYFSYRKTSDIDCPLTFVGFTSYFQSMESVSESTTSTTTTYSYVPGKMNLIEKYPSTNLLYLELDDTKAPTPAVEIPSITYNLDGLLTGNLSPRKSIIQPAYKIEDDKIYRKYPSESIWKEVTEMYIITNIRYGEKQNYSITTTNPVAGRPPIVTNYTIQNVYFGSDKYTISPGTVTSLEISSSKVEFEILEGTGTTNDPFKYSTNYISDIGYTDICAAGTEWYDPYDTVQIKVKYKNVIENLGDVKIDPTTSIPAYGDIYCIGWLCADGSPSRLDKTCEIATVSSTNNATNISVSNGVITISEQDIYPSEQNIYYGKGNFPVIKGSHFVLLRNHLGELINAVIDLSVSSLGFTPADNSTKSVLKAFLNAQAAKTADFDKDNPDTSFQGYQAKATGIIKVEFYNVLVDAYKLLINGCICNSDCYCNSNCVCNSNCGCNYSG